MAVCGFLQSSSLGSALTVFLSQILATDHCWPAVPGCLSSSCCLQSWALSHSESLAARPATALGSASLWLLLNTPLQGLQSNSPKLAREEVPQITGLSPEVKSCIRKDDIWCSMFSFVLQLWHPFIAAHSEKQILMLMRCPQQSAIPFLQQNSNFWPKCSLFYGRMWKEAANI